MRMKRCVAGVVVLLCVGRAEAGFLESFATSLAENKAIEQAPDCTLSADEAYARSIELLSDGRQTEAEELIQSAVKSYRDDIRILFAKAVLDRSRWAKSSANVWFAMVWQAQGNEALSRAAGLSGKLDRHEAVEKNMAELIRLSDEHPDEIYLLWLGAIQCRQQTRNKWNPSAIEKLFIKQGRQCYENLLKKFRVGPVMLHHTYANLLTENSKEYEKALEHRMLAISMTSGDWALQGLGNTLILMKKYEWANAVWARTVRQCPSDADYWNRWGATLLALNRYDEAIEKLREAVRLRPQNKTYRRDLALFLNLVSKIEEGSKSVAMYQQAVERGDKLALKDLAQCYFDGTGVKKDFDKAFELFQRAFEQGDTSALKGLARCYYWGDGVEKNSAKGIELYKIYVENFPESEKEIFLLGEYYSDGIRRKKNYSKAAKYFEATLKLNPEHGGAKWGLIKILLYSENPALSDYPRVIKMIEGAKSGGSADDEYLAEAYYKNKQYDKAVIIMEECIDRWTRWLKKEGTSFPDEKRKKLQNLEKYKKALSESKEAK